MESYKGPICGNFDSRYVGIRKGKPYCRNVQHLEDKKQLANIHKVIMQNTHSIMNLLMIKKRLSKQLVENYENGIDSLVHAVCGSPKILKT